MGKVAGKIQQWPHGSQTKCSCQAKSCSQGSDRERIPGEVGLLEGKRGVEGKLKFEELHDKDMAPAIQGTPIKKNFAIIPFVKG